MKGLIIKQPWIDLILDGKKDWEIRGNNTSIRGKIYLIQSGSGLITGEVELVDSLYLTLDEYKTSQNHHCIENTFQFPYKKTYAWVLKNPVRYKEPIPYKHPMGAVIWVNL